MEIRERVQMTVRTATRVIPQDVSTKTMAEAERLLAAGEVIAIYLTTSGHTLVGPPMDVRFD